MDFTLEKEFSKSPALQEIDALKKQINDMRPLPTDVEDRITQDLRRHWNFHSNAIEGNKLTYNETVAFILNGTIAEGKPLRDHLDIQGHDEAITFVSSIKDDERPISEADIRALHKMILVEPYETKAQTSQGLPTTKLVSLGEYKSLPNHVRTATGEIHHYATPEETPAKMQELMEWYIEVLGNPEIHSVVIAVLFHHKFVSIHPFDDGNGRLSRILMNLILIKNGFQPVIINVGDRNQYYELLRSADCGDSRPLIEYIAEHLKYSMEMFSDWKSYRFQVRVEGILSEWSRISANRGFKVMGNVNRTLDLFCSYSNLDIPIGATFNCFEKNGVQTFLNGKAVLIAVTQQFSIPFEGIPHGWKTISKFEFSEEDVRILKKEMLVVDSWTFTSSPFYLIKIE